MQHSYYGSLSELYENLPEVGDLDKPKLVYFFDEATRLFGQSNAAVQEKIELIVRLIRSKGISIFFNTKIQRIFQMLSRAN